MAQTRTKAHRYDLWDYSWPGLYFITICTKGRICCFGRIENGRMVLSRIGYTLRDRIGELPARFRSISIDIFQIMPDHVHMIIRIYKKNQERLASPTDAALPQTDLNEVIRKKGIQPMESGSIPSIVNHLKGRVTIWCRHHNYSEFQWQEGYYDEIIKNETHYLNVREYIRRNPENWGKKE